MESGADYRPINFPARYQTYEMAPSLPAVGDDDVDPLSERIIRRPIS
jgi:hypothetical protein